MIVLSVNYFVKYMGVKVCTLGRVLMRCTHSESRQLSGLILIMKPIFMG